MFDAANIIKPNLFIFNFILIPQQHLMCFINSRMKTERRNTKIDLVKFDVISSGFWHKKHTFEKKLQ